jgi:transcriptional regulator with XRE-family HTH domain
MRGQDFKNIRQKMGLERIEFARLIGFTGSDRNDLTRIRQYERGHNGRQIPLYIARLVWLLSAHQRRTGILPEFPGWPGYQFETRPDPQHQKEIDHG